jgi:formate dehydrogenase maturation protein FdhE
VTTTKLARESAPSGIGDDLRPLLRVHEELARFRLSPTRARRARANVSGGRVAFDATEVIRSAGNLDAHLGRMAMAFEMCGLASERELEAVRREHSTAEPLITAWLAGERGAPNDHGRRTALRAASLVANAVLRSAAAQASKGAQFTHWKQTTCPCCGGSPDIAVRAAGTRWLVCSRCDTKWLAPTAGCLGCEATRPPTFVRVDAPDLGYELLVCHACARYMKERAADGMQSPLVERAVTVELDAAAERRGLRI